MRPIFLMLLGFCLWACTGGEERDPINEIHRFWFGNLRDDGDFDPSRFGLWFGKSEEVDQKIRDQFGDLMQRAKKGKLDHWLKTPRGTLAFIILVDQFPRNAHRGTAQAFAFDSLAQKVTLEALERGDDQQLKPIERVFFYLPLEHAEDPTLQELSVKKFTELFESQSAKHKTKFAGALEYAIQHKEIIDRFGRFPHRNGLLGRPSTPEEKEFLTTPGSSF